MKSEITRAGLIDLVRTLVEERRTSTIYVHTDDNHLIAVGVDAGEIVSLICGPKHGERAIPMIQKMVRGTYRLDDKVTALTRFGARLPSTEELLSLLEDGSAAAPIDGVDCEWVQTVLCKVLAPYMGPIAPLVCRETISAAGGIDSAAGLRRVVDNLAAEIDAPDEADAFKAEVRKALGRRLD